MDIEAHIVNAFAEKIGEGNQAGVVFLGDWLPDESMRLIASDIGKSETAFLVSCGGGYRIRWFAPLKEMPLCGHATLAATAVIFGKRPELRSVGFIYAGGTIDAERSADGFISMGFPLDDYAEAEIDPAYAGFFGTDAFIGCVAGARTGKTILIADPSLDLSSIRPDFTRMSSHRGSCTAGIGVSRVGGPAGCDFETRYFNPWAGVTEDPVTGSVHTVLARYWSDRLGKTELSAYQRSHRPGTLSLSVRGDSVRIGGKAVPVMSGVFRM